MDYTLALRVFTTLKAKLVTNMLAKINVLFISLSRAVLWTPSSHVEQQYLDSFWSHFNARLILRCWPSDGDVSERRGGNVCFAELSSRCCARGNANPRIYLDCN